MRAHTVAAASVAPEVAAALLLLLLSLSKWQSSCRSSSAQVLHCLTDLLLFLAALRCVERDICDQLSRLTAALAELYERGHEAGIAASKVSRLCTFH